ncbi:MAG: flagellar basal body rod protein FlgB [Planctomycetota bacterium]|jgi:flagellar basal-body rod protein FlgB
MLKTLFTKGAIPELNAAISFASQRHRVILNNLANVDTPYYMAQDLPEKEFKAQLRDAIENRERGGNPRMFRLKPSRMIPLDNHGMPMPRTVTSKTIGQLRHDMGTVDPDMEMAKLAKNTGFHNGLLQLLAHQYGLLEDAIVGRPRA